jgi:Protein of unknown function (DUF1552)
MFITKMSLPRRTFLRGVGVSMALPFLEAMVPAFTATAKTAANPRLRFGAVYVPHGAIMDQWTPPAGPGLTFTPILKPLEVLRDQVSVISNLFRAGEADHAVSVAAWLSSAVAKRTEAEDVRLGVTLDQIIAKSIGQETPFPSLELATEDFTGYVGGCSPGYSCAYMNTLSWATPTTPLPMEINPRVVFERLFGRAGTPAQRLARMEKNRSVLDSIREDARELQNGLGSADRARLTGYLDDIREIERRIQQTETKNKTQLTALDAPLGVPDVYGDHAALMFDLATVAYQADLTRVFTFMMAREASFKTYPEVDITIPHHPLSHHGNNPTLITTHAKLNTYHASLFAKFVTKLRATPDGDGSLLDHSLLLYGSGMSNGNAHSAGPLPLLAVGGGVGKGDRHVQTAPKTPLGNMWVSVAEKFGVEVTSIGGSNGRVDLG